MQPYFKEMHDNDVRQRIYDDQRDAIEQDMAPLDLLMMDWMMSILQMHKEMCGRLRNTEINPICGSSGNVSKI